MKPGFELKISQLLYVGTIDRNEEQRKYMIWLKNAQKILIFYTKLRQQFFTYSDQYIIAWWSLTITEPNNEIIYYPS